MSEKSENTTLRQLTLFAGDSLARTSAMPEKGRGLRKEPDRDCGLNSIASFVNYDRDSSSWKTSQLSLFGKSGPYSETWPRAGMMRNGRCYQQRPLVPPILGTDASFLPTPVAYDSTPGGPGNHYKGLGWMGKHLWPTPQQKAAGKPGLSPAFNEYLMGFPIGWTDLEHSETP